MSLPDIGSLATVSFGETDNHPYIVTSVGSSKGTMKHVMNTNISEDIMETSDGWKVPTVEQDHTITFQDLPMEIIDKIILDSKLSKRDIRSARLASKRLHEAVDISELCKDNLDNCLKGAIRDGVINDINALINAGAYLNFSEFKYAFENAPNNKVKDYIYERVIEKMGTDKFLNQFDYRFETSELMNYLARLLLDNPDQIEFLREYPGAASEWIGKLVEIGNIQLADAYIEKIGNTSDGYLSNAILASIKTGNIDAFDKYRSMDSSDRLFKLHSPGIAEYNWHRYIIWSRDNIQMFEHLIMLKPELLDDIVIGLLKFGIEYEGHEDQDPERIIYIKQLLNRTTSHNMEKLEKAARLAMMSDRWDIVRMIYNSGMTRDMIVGIIKWFTDRTDYGSNRFL